jgi:3-phenylpropionate/trans-cinnamate dioxygenase ferredoxin reductase subunit
MAEHLIIVGGGAAAAQAVQTLRQQNFAGEITLIGEELHAPYQRPPLSKKYLAGELPRERLLVRPERFYADKGVTLVRSCRVEELDPASASLRLADGRTLTYDRLLLTTGSRARRVEVPGENLPGVHYLRTIEDVDAITAELHAGTRVVLVGAGYIGLEVAAVLVRRGLAVTVLEAADRVMARVVCPQISEFYAREHRAAGVEVHFNRAVSAFRGAPRVTAVEVANGERFDCDVAIVGVGVLPNIELALAAGLPCANGISVDECARTADPRVFAAGDCTSHFLPLLERSVRLESVGNAVHQAKVAALAALGTPQAYSEVPWFWSDQYDLKLQIAGLAQGYDEVVVRGNPAARAFAAYYLADGIVIAVDAVNSPRDFASGRKLVAAHAAVPAETLADTNADLAALV